MAYEAEQQEFTTRVIAALRKDHVGKELNEKQIEQITEVCTRSFEQSAGYPLERTLRAASVGIRLALGTMKVGLVDRIVEKVTGDREKRFAESDDIAVFNLRMKEIIREMVQAREGSEKPDVESSESAVAPGFGEGVRK